MKRSDIKVGDVLYYSRHRDWEMPAYGSADGEKATVVGLWWAERKGWGWPQADRKYEVPEGTKGAGVLVEYVPRFGPAAPIRTVVSLAHLRGPYEETRKRVEEWVARRDAQIAEQQARQADARTKAARIADSAKTIGVRAENTGSGRSMLVPMDQLDAMVAALSAAGWQYVRPADDKKEETS